MIPKNLQRHKVGNAQNRPRAFTITLKYSHNTLNPSAWRHLNPSSYCEGFFTGYLNYGLNCREKNEEIISRNSLPHYKRASSFTNKREAA